MPSAYPNQMLGMQLRAWSSSAAYDPGFIPIGLYMPNDEAAEIAALLGIPADQILRFDMPAGMSRVGSLKCLLTADDIRTIVNTWTRDADRVVVNMLLRSDTTDLSRYWRFFLKSAVPFVYTLRRSSTTNADGEGMYLCEFVDSRWLMNRKGHEPSISNPSDIRWPWTQMRADDGRIPVVPWQDVFGNPPATYIETVVALASECKAAVGQDFPLGLDTSFIAADASTALGLERQERALQRVADIVRNGTTPVPLVLDLLLQQAGYCALPSLYRVNEFPAQPQMRAINIDGDLADGQLQGMIAGGSGFLNQSVTPGAGSRYLLREAGPVGMQYNLLPRLVDITWPVRAPERATYYNNVSQSDSAFTVQGVLNNSRAQYVQAFETLPSTFRIDQGYQTAVSNDLAFTKDYGSSGVFQSADYTAQNSALNIVMQKKMRAKYGRRVWGGIFWQDIFSHRISEWSIFCTKHKNEWTWITTTDTKWDDWLAGPLVEKESDPKDLVIGSGTIRAWRNSAGMIRVDAAPAATRVFPARITSSVRLAQSGDGYWQWLYTFEEIEPNVAALLPMIVNGDGWSRSTSLRSITARNLCEYGNIYLGAANVGNYIAPGVAQSQYPNATVEPLPIGNNTVVMMCEQSCNNLNQTDPSTYAIRYWFSMPNAILTTCIGE